MTRGSEIRASKDEKGKTPQKPVATSSQLQKIRRGRGLGATQIARLVGVSRQTNYAIESGEYLPNKGVALQLARVLEVSVEGPFSPTAAPAIIPGQHQRRASCYCER